jgi:ribosomal protein S18 acetylase RimI-like enzyme
MEIVFRNSTLSDIPAMARLRSFGWGDEAYWTPRITGYLKAEHHPQQALLPRVAFVAMDGGKAVGFIAGHLTTRLGCEGELEWIDVMPEYRRKGIARELTCLLAAWFTGRSAKKICVDPGNDSTRKFYAALGAEDLNVHWMYWQDISTLLV